MLQFNSLSTNFIGLIRNESLEGRPFLAVPMVMIVEGVLNGSNGPILYPSEELAKVPQVWNHKPIVVYHPEMNGKALSACEPSVIEKQKVGIIMNSSFDGKRLIAEAWLEPSRLELVDNRVLEALNNGQMMEVSTGLYTENEEVSGEFSGIAYNSIARNLRPDHLAILPDQIGACSIEDGAGLLRNARNQKDVLHILDMIHINMDMSFDQIRSALYDLLRNTMEPNVDYWIEDTFESFFVYTKNCVFYKQEYKNEDGKIEFVGLPVQVIRKIVYEENGITVNQKGDTMKEELVARLLTNGRWTESDKEFLLSLNEEQLAKMLPAETQESESVEVTEEKPVEDSTPVTVENYLANAPKQIQEVLGEAIATHNSHKIKLVNDIVANKNNTFTKEFLMQKSVQELNAIVLLANATAPAPTSNFIGMAPVGVTNKTTEESPLEMVTLNYKG